MNKAINARLHGAKGIVFLSDPLHQDEEVGPATRRIEFTDMGIPAIHAKRAAFAQLFRAAGKDLAAIQTEIDRDLQPRSFDLPGTQARIATEVIRNRKTRAQCDRRARRLRSGAEERVGRGRRPLRSSGPRRARLDDAVTGRTDPSRRRRQCVGDRGRDGARAARRQ